MCFNIKAFLPSAESKSCSCLAEKNANSSMNWNSSPEEKKAMYNEKAASVNQESKYFANVDNKVARLLTCLRQLVSDL